MPAVNDVGEPCAGEPLARFDAAAGGNPGQSASPCGPGSLPPTLQGSDDTKRGVAVATYRERREGSLPAGEDAALVVALRRRRGGEPQRVAEAASFSRS